MYIYIYRERERCIFVIVAAKRTAVLLKCFLAFCMICMQPSQILKKKFTEAPLDAERPSDGAQVIPVVEGDETSEIKAKIYQQVMSKRKERQKFYYLNSWEKKPWADGGDATGIFQRSAFAASGAQVSAPGKVNKLMMFSPPASSEL